MHIPQPLLFTLLLSCLGLSSLYAQKGPVAAGGDATGSGGSVSYSIGQIDYISATGSSGNINQGLQQPFEFYTMGLEDQAIQLGLAVYPNPTTSFISLRIDKADFSGLSYHLYDMSGKLLLSQVVSEKITSIDMGAYASATYILQVLNTQQPIQSFRIIKK